MSKIFGSFSGGSGVYMYCITEDETASVNRASGVADSYTYNFFMGRDDTKAVLVASPEYTTILADYVLDGAYFYFDTINIDRVSSNGGRTPAGDYLSKWVVTVNFKNVTAADNKRDSLILKPSEKPPVITWTSRTTEMAATADAYGKPYFNTAGDYFEGISRLADEYIYKFNYNIAVPVAATLSGEPRSRAAINLDVAALDASGGYEPSWLYNLSNTTNLYGVQIRGSNWPPNTLRAGGFAAGSVSIEAGEVYIPVSWEMVGHSWNWTREVANVGTNSLHFTILAGGINGTYNGNTYTPGNAPATEQPIDGYEFYDYLLAWRTTNGGSTDPVQVATDVSAILRDTNRVVITKKPIFGVSDPVFLDGWGQHEPGANPPGFLDLGIGTATAAPTIRHAYCDFNVYDFLGARLDDGNGNVFYVPNLPDNLATAQRQSGYTGWAADFAAKASNVLPLLSARTVNGVYKFSRFHITKNFNFQLVEGSTLIFQDYPMRDHTALPGVYPSTIF